MSGFIVGAGVAETILVEKDGGGYYLKEVEVRDRFKCPDLLPKIYKKMEGKRYPTDSECMAATVDAARDAYGESSDDYLNR